MRSSLRVIDHRLRALDAGWQELDHQTGLRAFYVLMVATALTSSAADQDSPWMTGALACASAATLLPPARAHYAGCCLAFALQCTRAFTVFPATANHAYLQTLILGLGVLHGHGAADERRLLLRCLRWLGIVALLAAGLQKVLYGQYFDGRFLAVMAAKHQNYRLVLTPLLPDSELARLVSYSIHRDGDGPFRVDSVPFLVVSNLAWAGELAAGLLLIWRPRWGAWAAIVLLVAIELAARELVFGAVMVGLFLLSASPRVASPALRALAVLAYVLALVGLEWLPGRSTFFGFEVW